MDVGADLRTGANRGPRVDHRPRPDPGADVDETGHQDHTRREKGAVPRDPAGNDAHAAFRVVVLERDLVEVVDRAGVHGLDLAEVEVEKDRLLRPLVDDPAVVARLGHPELPGVEQAHRLLDRRGFRLTGGEKLLDPLLELHRRIITDAVAR